MKINLSFLIILFVSILTFFNDILIGVLRIDYLISLILAFCITGIFLLMLLKKSKLTIENNFCKTDLFFLIPYILFVLIKIVFPDYYADVLTYHYYKQEYVFVDKINYDFLVCGGKVNDFVYPLADRMNYIFRFFLGLRLGTILSYFSVIILFYQIKKIIRFLNPKVKNYLQILVGLCAIFMPILYRFIGKYYIDIYSTIFLLEIFYIGLKENNIFTKKKNLYYWFLICGISIGIKISNLILVIPIGINIIINNIKNFKNLKFFDYTICIVMFFVPFVIYGVNNMIQVGNFFYPFLGRKKYYNSINWNDPSWGIPNIFYAFIWPIVVSIFPAKGHNEEYLYEWIWAVGYIWLIMNIFIKIYKKKYRTILFRSEIINVIFCFLWAILMNGYCRYAMIIPILFIINIISNFETENKKINFISIFQICAIFIIMSTSIYNVKKITFLGYYLEEFKKELKNTFIDKNCTVHIDGVWGSINSNGGMTSLLREEGTPIYNLEDIYIKDSKYLYDKYKNLLKNKNIYVVTSKLYRPSEKTLKLLADKNFEVIEKVAEYDCTEIPYMQNEDKWEIYKVRYKLEE